MKYIKTTLLVVAAAAGIYTVSAQTIAAAKVPQAVKSAFMKAFPTVAKVKWEKEKGNYEAGFMHQKQEMSAVFTAAGSMLESETEINTTALPAAVPAYIKEHYKGKTIKEAAKITKTGGEVNYEAEVDGKDLIFNSSGKFIEIAKD
jgi:hypothetical protein